MLEQRKHIFNANLQKQLLLDFNQKSKIKLHKYYKSIADKKDLMTIIYRQCNEATKTKISLGRTYNTDCQDGNLIEFIKQVRIVCFRSDNRGLSFGPYKQAVSVKLMNNYSNNKLHDPHGFKEVIKTKFYVVKAVVEKFPNKTEAMMKILGRKRPARDWTRYCLLTPTQQLVWEERGDDLTKSMLFLLNSKNNNTKKDARLAYSQENKKAYPLSIEAMARYMSTRYPSKNSGHQCEGNKGDRN